MPLKFKCEFCDAEIETDTFKKGDKFGCGSCHELITVPQDAEGNSILLKKGGIYHCSLCGAVNDGTASICSNCEADVETTSVVCASCEVQNKVESQYCRHCGKKLVEQTFRTVRYCEKCKSEYDEGDDFCQRDGSKLVTKKIEIDSEDLQPAKQTKDGSKLIQKELNPEIISGPEKGFYAKLVDGDYGLAKTYWAFGVFVGISVNIILQLMEASNFLIFLYAVYLAYEIPVLIGTWRAGEKYQGKSIWVVLTKITVVLGWFGWVVGVGILFITKFLEPFLAQSR